MGCGQAQLDEACCDLVVKLVRSAGSASLKVNGLSMMPAIWPGDVLSVRRQAPGELRPGQILLFQRDGRLTAHRLIRIEGDRLITRGDALSWFDQPVNAAEVVGQVAGISRNRRVVKLKRSLWQRAAAQVLRRSDLCLRLLMYARAAAKRLKAVLGIT